MLKQLPNDIRVNVATTVAYLVMVVIVNAIPALDPYALDIQANFVEGLLIAFAAPSLVVFLATFGDRLVGQYSDEATHLIEQGLDRIEFTATLGGNRVHIDLIPDAAQPDLARNLVEQVKALLDHLNAPTA